MLNEVTMIVLTYILFLFSDLYREALMRTYLGRVYIGVTFTNISIHLFFLAMSVAGQITSSVKRVYTKCVTKRRKTPVKCEQSSSQKVELKVKPTT